MRHLKHSTEPPKVFIDRVIASKKAHKADASILAKRKSAVAAGCLLPVNMTYKERCAEIRKLNDTEIDGYQKAFDSDNLYAVSKGVPVSLRDPSEDCEDMLGLYSFGSAVLGKLWTDVLSADGYLNDTCPICEAVKATTFDHYLPKTEYQLYAVHPLNLIPCCTVCNGHKLKNLFDANNKRRFWNAYIDVNITEQYLFCDIYEENGMPKVKFRVEQGNLPHRYFEIVKNSFDGLKLNDNYQESSGRVIISLKDSCCNFFIKNQHLGLEACIQNVADTIPGTNVNYWENVLCKALIVHDLFKIFVKAALKQEYGIIA